MIPHTHIRPFHTPPTLPLYPHTAFRVLLTLLSLSLPSQNPTPVTPAHPQSLSRFLNPNNFPAKSP